MPDGASREDRVAAALRDARQRLERMQAERAAPIAIVGVGCRFPGGADSPAAFWELLAGGMDAVRDFPSERDEAVDGAWARLEQAGVAAHVRRGGFLDRIDEFDREVFGISEAEAAALDPQQRALLEVTWHALEDAAIDPRSLRGSRTGVWVGISNADYARNQLHASDGIMDAYTLTGSSLSVAAGRLAFVFGLHGPTMAIDTACSSSLVALHLAAQSLRAGECDLAIVAGVQFIIEPEVAIGLDRIAALSPSARCRAFDASADGFVRGEGCAAVVLRRASDAARGGDPVRAHILGSAVNQDGASSGLTAPNGRAQRDVIRAALANAGVQPRDVSYIEAHGTGTALGDPIELNALADVFGDAPLSIGSVKTNLGHLEAAAGLAGLVKIVLAMEHAALPPHLHLAERTPHFEWDHVAFDVPTTLRPWAPPGRRIAGLSSFGFSGTNAHIVVSEPERPFDNALAPREQRSRAVVFPVSAYSEHAAEAVAEQWVASANGSAAGPAGRTARLGRAHLRARRAWIVDAAQPLGDQLRAQAPLVASAGAGRGELAWLFTGQGAQYGGMGRDLYDREPLFRAELDACAELADPLLGRPVVALLFESDDASLAETAVSQVAIVVLQLALARTWRRLGLRPDFVVGHSVGEIAAACVAGALSEADAIKFAIARGRAMQAVATRGAMCAAFAPVERIAELLHQVRGTIGIAGVNGPSVVTISGDLDAIAAVERVLDTERVAHRRLDVSHAFHSPLMAPAADALRAAAFAVRWRDAAVRIVSTATGDALAPSAMADPEYWVRQALGPVRFLDAICTADAAGARSYLELGPSNVLTGLAASCVAAPERAWISSLRRGTGDQRQFMDAVARVYVGGAAIHWNALDDTSEAESPAGRVRGPLYPFERRRYWRYAERVADIAASRSASVRATAHDDAAPSAVADAAEPAAEQPVLSVTDVLPTLMTILANVGGPAADVMDVDANLFSLGVDSIMLIQARQLILRELGVEIELSRLHGDTATLTRLAEHIVESLALRGDRRGRPAPTAVPSPPTAAGAPRANVLPNRPGRAPSADVAALQRAHIRDLAPRYGEATAESKRRADASRAVFASGRNLAGFRADWKELIYQIVAGEAHGATITDADGRVYRDFAMGFGVAMFGHSPPFVRRALERELARGMPLGPLSDLAGEAAERVCDLTGVDRVAFFNTGSEAVMNAVRIARSVTGRSTIALFEGSYHGTFDGVLAVGDETVVAPMSPGTPQGMVGDLIVLPYGDPASLDVLARRGSELAAVLVEPVQSRRPHLQPDWFVRELRAATERDGTALILDEMITGFRCHPGGIQKRWGVRADLVTYGKILGGGLPIGAVGGRREFMDAVDGGAWRYGDDSVPTASTTFTSGTFCNHPLAMAAACAVLDELGQRGEPSLARAERLTQRLCAELNAFFDAECMPLRMVSFSSLFRFVFEADLEMLFYHLLLRGIYVWEGRNCFLSAAHTDEDVDAFVAAVQDGLHEMRRAGLVPERRAVAIRTSMSPAIAPASPAQRRLYLLHEIGGGDVAYHIQQAIAVDGPLHVDRLAAAWRETVAAHESLRTRFQLDGETLVQHVEPHVAALVDMHDCPDVTPLDAVGVLREAVVLPFDLSVAPLVRVGLARLSDDRHVLLLDAHHAVCDGISMAVLVEDLFARYDGTPLPVGRPYRDHAHRELAREQSAAMRRDEEYWRAAFADDAPALDLPSDHPRPSTLTLEGDVVRRTLDTTTLSTLKAAARGSGTTLYALLLAAYSALLYRLGGQDDLVIGVPVAGRPGDGLDRTVGMFVGTLPLRFRVDGTAPFARHVAATASTMFTAFDHAAYPFERLVEALARPRDPSRNPLFDTMFEFETSDGDQRRVGDLDVRALTIDDGRAMFDLDVEVVQGPDALRIAFRYRTRLFERGTIESYVDAYVDLLRAAVADPSVTVNAVAMLSSAARQRVLTAWNGTDQSTDALSDTLHALVQRSAGERPTATALVLGDVEVSYGALVERAAVLARRLGARGIGAECFVGIHMERSVDLYVAFLGVLMAGAAYVPLDPESPDRRLAALCAELGQPYVLTQRRLAEAAIAAAGAGRALIVEELEAEPLPAMAPLPRVDPETAAYALFTSGSTGRPKCVVVPHRAIVNHTRWYIAQFGLTRDDIMLQKTVFTFDTSLSEIYASFAAGARLVVPRPGEHGDPRHIVELIRRHGVTVLEDVPSFTELLVDEPGFEACTTLRWHNPGGEALTAALAARVVARRPVQMANLYGPTEAAVDTVFKVVDPAGTGAYVPIGQPVSNVCAFVLDARMEPVPIGVVGELYIGGASLGRGYHALPGATAEKFVPNPFAATAGERLYRTGDRVRRTGNGDIVFLGRTDHQTKIRGLRIELGEIDAALLTHPDVRAAVTTAQPDGRGGQTLVSYVAPATATSDSLRDWLADRLPPYMVSNAFVLLATLPLTPSGKIDRRALPAPLPASADSARTRRVPRDDTERAIAAIFADVLHVADVGIDDDFFVLGGHSLLAAQLVSRIRSTLAVELPFRAVFEAPSVAGVARAARTAGHGSDEAGNSTPTRLPTIRHVADAQWYPLSWAQRALWAACRVQDDANAYNMSEAYRVEGELDLRAMDQALRAVIAAHEVLRTAFVEKDGEVGQQVRAVPDHVLACVDLSAESEPLSAAMRLVDAAARHPFDFESGSMLRATVFLLGPNDHLLLFTVHHLAFDAWSTRVLVEDLWAAYEQARRGDVIALHRELQYRDYACWQQELFRGGHLDAARDHWRQTFLQPPPALALPADRTRPTRRSLRGGHVHGTIDSAATAAVASLARDAGATPFMVLQAAVKALLYMYSGQRDLTIGTLTAGRADDRLERQVGCYLNTLALRDGLDPRGDFTTLVRQVRATTLAAFEHQLYPFDALLADLRVPRQAGRQPLFDVMVNMIDADLTGAEFSDAEWTGASGALRVSHSPLAGRDAKYDLTWNIEAHGGETRITLEYSDDLFDRATAAAVLQRFQSVLAAALTQPTRSLDDLAAAAELPVAQLTAQPVRSGEPAGGLYDRFHAAARRTPHAIALTDGVVHVSYAELEARAATIASALIEGGVTAESIVAVCVAPSTALVASILGVLRAGCAYLPIDPEYPAEHIASVLADSGARLAIARDDRAAVIARSGVRCIHPDATRVTAGHEAASVAADQAAYVIYTSGSTGTPKGCVVTHGNVLRLLDATRESFAFGRNDVFTLFHSSAFDFSVWELWGALAFGGRLIVVPRDTARDPDAFVAMLRDERVTVLNQTPSAFYRIADAVARDPGAIRVIVFGGEPLEFSRLRPLVGGERARAIRLVNMYGITETTVHVTARELTRDDVLEAKASAIGRALDHLAVYVLDDSLNPAPIEESGELYVSGGGVSRGYLHRAALTASRFVPDPFARTPGARMYRSGDLGRRLTGGDIEYLGRADEQIKIRGFRIEPREIEVVLATHPSVREARVIAQLVPAADPRLAAYVISAAPWSAAELRAHLESRLPRHMVPSTFTAVDAFPLTRNGKLDRAALPQPDRLAEPGAGARARTPTERLLAEIWRDVLRVTSVGLHDNFFELGGDSILSVQIASRAAAYGIPLNAQSVFQHQTVAELAVAAAAAAADQAEQGTVRGPVPLLPIQHWFLDQEMPASAQFAQSVLLTVTTPDADALARALHALVVHHDALRLCVRSGDRGWHAEVLAPTEELFALPVVDLSSGGAAARAAGLDAEIRKAYGELDPAAGRMVAARLAAFGAGEPHRLLIVIHHLAVDAVSWRVLIEDLETAYRASLENRAPALPPKTSSIRQWGDYLDSLAHTDALRSERDLWVHAASQRGDLPGRSTDTAPRDASGGVHLSRVDMQATARLLAAARAAGGGIEELLVAAAAACWRSEGARTLRLDLESHGRDDPPSGISLARSVGWLTAIYPVCIDVSSADADAAAAVLDATRGALRAVRRHGLGFGVLRWIARDPALRGAPMSEVIFNFLGRVDLASPGESADAVFGLAPESAEPADANQTHRTHALEITASIARDELTVAWNHDASIDRAAIARMASSFATKLEAVLAAADAPSGSGDAHLPGILAGELATLLADIPRPE